jgi:hypothetical protein
MKSAISKTEVEEGEPAILNILIKKKINFSISNWAKIISFSAIYRTYV